MLLILAAVLGGLALLFLLTLVFGWVALRRLTSYRLLTAAPAGPPLTTVETVVCGAALGVLAGFIHSFGLGAPYPALLQALIGIAGTYGVNVIVGPSFRNLLNLNPGVLMLISMGLVTVQVTLPAYGLDATTTSILQGVITLAYSLGFGTAVTTATAKRVAAR